MPYTVHTLDGQAHTYPEPVTLCVEDDGSLRAYAHVEKAPGPFPLWMYPDPIAAYPAGQWTHYHVEPAPYETDAQAGEDTDEARQGHEVQVDISAEETDRWKAAFQRHLDAGRKAAEAQ